MERKTESPVDIKRKDPDYIKRFQLRYLRRLHYIVKKREELRK